MPWKETNLVDLRREFLMRAQTESIPFVRLCQEFGISPKTGYKWKERFAEEGRLGLADRSRRPHSCPGQLTEDVILSLIRLKTAHKHWGPKKVLDGYQKKHPFLDPPSISGIKRVLDKAGLVEHRKRRRQEQCGRLGELTVPREPNDLWTVDFKGYWYSSDRRKIEPLTLRDAASRYVFTAQPIEDAATPAVKAVFEREFLENGLPLAIRSDNGPPFACISSPMRLTRLSAWWVALGIDVERIDPGRPYQNGGHERMHRDMALEVEGVVEGDAQAHWQALQLWRREFNCERPHEALAMKTPAEVYVKSPRKYTPGEIELVYPTGYLARRVGSHGTIKLESRRIQISTALDGWDVGLEPSRGGYALWFGKLCLGKVDMDSESFTPVRG